MTHDETASHEHKWMGQCESCPATIDLKILLDDIAVG